jgi:hypothetical protein
MPPLSKPTAVVRLTRVLRRPEAEDARRTDRCEMQSGHRTACQQERKPASRVVERPFPIAKLSPIKRSYHRKHHLVGTAFRGGTSPIRLYQWGDAGHRKPCL